MRAQSIAPPGAGLFRRWQAYPDTLYAQVAQIVEISLRVPSLRVRKEGQESPETISNADIRFIKRVEVESIPKTGAVLEMTMGGSQPFQCEVVRSDWHETKNCFVIACRYSKRSISPAEYQALTESSDWTLTHSCRPSDY